MRNVTNYWTPDEHHYIQTIITGAPKNSKEIHYGVLGSDNELGWFVKDAEELKNEYKAYWNKETPDGIDRTRMHDGNMDCHDYMSEGIILDIDYSTMEKDLCCTPYLHSMIRKCLNKEIHPDITSNVNFIASLLHDAYESGVQYDVSDLRNDICTFAAGSINENCLKTVLKMEFKSMEDSSLGSEYFSNIVRINIYNALEKIYDKISFLKDFDIDDRRLFENAVTSIICDVCPIIAFDSGLCDMYDVSDCFNMFDIKPLKKLSNNGESFTFGINNTDYDGHIVIYIMNNEEVFDND